MRLLLLAGATLSLGACALFADLDGFTNGSASGDAGDVGDSGSSPDDRADGAKPVTDSGGTSPNPLTDGGSDAESGVVTPPPPAPTLVVAGGQDGTQDLDQVHSADFLPDGGLGPWRAGPKLPSPRATYTRVLGIGDSFYVLDASQVWSSTRSATGVSSFTIAASFGGIYNPCAAAMGDTLVVMGGFSDDAPSAKVRAAVRGPILDWKDGASLPAPRQLHGCAATRDVVYQVGGKDAAGTHMATVFYARRGSNGLPGEWAETTPLPATNYWPRAVTLGKYLYVVTAEWDGPLVANSVIFARIGEDGKLGPWKVGTALPMSMGNAAVTAHGDRIVVAGGSVNNQARTDVLVATADATTGDLSAWSPVTSLPVAATELGAAFLEAP